MGDTTTAPKTHARYGGPDGKLLCGKTGKRDAVLRTVVHVTHEIVTACLSPGARGGQAGWPLATVTDGLPDRAVLREACVTARGDLRLVFEVPGSEDVAEQTMIKLSTGATVTGKPEADAMVRSVSDWLAIENEAARSGDVETLGGAETLAADWARQYCRELLEAAEANDCGGFPLCRG